MPLVEMFLMASMILIFDVSASSISFSITSTSHTAIIFSLRSVIVKSFSFKVALILPKQVRVFMSSSLVFAV